MAVHTFLAAIALLSWTARSALGAGCVDSSTVMFGAPWQPSFTVEEHESHYRESGRLSHVAAYFNMATGCVVGLKGTYGLASSTTSTLGVDFDNAADSSTLVAQEMQLPKGESIISVDYKVGSCIEYLRFITNTDQTLQIGNPDSPKSLQSSKPAPGSYLGFFKATVDSAVTVTEESAAHPLQQLQLIWVKAECKHAPPGDQLVIPPNAGVDVAAAANGLRIVAPQQKQKQQVGSKPSRKQPSKAVAKPSGIQKAQQQQQQQNLRMAQAAAPETPTDAASSKFPANKNSAEFPVADETSGQQTAGTESNSNADIGDSTVTGVTTPSNGTSTAAASAELKASGAAGGAACAPKGCDDGTCTTSSCALHGMGRDVPAMMCFGTNIIPKLLSKLDITPCANLACKLTMANCTSSGLLGIGGFCTGRVVAMGATSELHDTGRALIGYPCLEHRGVLTEVVTRFGDYSAKGTYVSKAWKVCDCAPVVAAVDGSNLVTLNDLGDIQVADKKGNDDVTHLRIITPTFNLGMPDVTAFLAKQNLSLPQLPTFGADKLQKPLATMSVADVVTQWMAAFTDLTTVPSLNLTEPKINALKTLIPGFSAPSIIVPNISAPLLRVPVSLDLPSFTIPEKMFASVALLLPSISNTSLPSLIVPSKLPPGIDMPSIVHVRNISTPNFYGMMEKFILKLPDYQFNVEPLQLPTSSRLRKAFEAPDVLSQWISGLVSNKPLPRIQVAANTLTELRNLLPKLPKLPTMVAPEAALPWFSKESTRNISTFVIPNNILPQVHKLMPNLTSLPTFLEPREHREIKIELPALTVPNVTLPSFKQQLGKILSHMRPIPTLKAYQKDASDHLIDYSYSLGDQMTDAADSLNSAVRQALGKLPGNKPRVDFAGLDTEKLSALSSSKTPSSAAAAVTTKDESHLASALLQDMPNPSAPPEALANPSAPPKAMANPSAPPTALPNPSAPPKALANPSTPPKSLPNPSAPPRVMPNPSKPPEALPNPSKPPTTVMSNPSKPPTASGAAQAPKPQTPAAGQAKPSKAPAGASHGKAPAATGAEPIVQEAPGLVVSSSAAGNRTVKAQLPRS